MKNRSLLAAAGLLAALVIGLAAFSWLQGSARHGDGEGPLGSYGGGFEAMKIDPIAAGGTSWTYGVGLCLVSGIEPAVLESVAPTKTVGHGFQFLGVGVREFTPTPGHLPIISVNTWPPPTSAVPDPLRAVHGFSVSTRCGQGPDARYTELLVGLGLVSADGGGWQGIEISYTVGGRHQILVMDHDLLICGASVDCSVPGST